MEDLSLWEEVSKRVIAQYTKEDANKRPPKSHGCKICGGPLFRKRCFVKHD